MISQNVTFKGDIIVFILSERQPRVSTEKRSEPCPQETDITSGCGTMSLVFIAK